MRIKQVKNGYRVTFEDSYDEFVFYDARALAKFVYDYYNPPLNLEND